MFKTAIKLLMGFVTTAILSSSAYASFAKCSDLFEALPSLESLNGGLIESVHPFIQETHLAEIARIKAQVDEEVFKDFVLPRNLHIQVGYGLHTKPGGDHVGQVRIYVPFDYPKTKLSKYVSQRNPPVPVKVSFQTVPSLVHEYAHMVLDSYFRTHIIRYNDHFKYFETMIQEGLSTEQACDQAIVTCDILKNARSRFIALPYDEFLADFAAVLLTEDPDANRQQLLKFQLDSKHGTLSSSIRRKITKSESPRSFKTRYLRDINSYGELLLLGKHELLGPARSAVWRLYLGNRKVASKSTFFRKVVQTTVEVVNARIMSETSEVTEYNLEDLLSEGTTAKSINLDLIRKLESIDFTKP